MIQAERPWVQAVFAWNLNYRIFQDYHGWRRPSSAC